MYDGRLDNVEAAVNWDAVTLWVTNTKAVIAEDFLSDIAGFDASSALQASIALDQKPGLFHTVFKARPYFELMGCTA